MSEKTRSIKVNDVTDKEVRDYLLQLSAFLNEIKCLEGEKSEINKSLNTQIKSLEDKVEKLRIILNDGVVETLYNFMDKETFEIIWKDKEGNEIERTPFDGQDWEIYERQYGPRQKPLFNEDEDEDPFEEKDPEDRPALIEGEIIEDEGEEP